VHCDYLGLPSQEAADDLVAEALNAAYIPVPEGTAWTEELVRAFYYGAHELTLTSAIVQFCQDVLHELQAIPGG
jgi:hypothetical protein